MHKTPITLTATSRKVSQRFIIFSVIAALMGNCFCFSQEASDETLIEQWIQSQNNGNMILFDANNIKQFWVDKTVAAKNGVISISLQKNKTPNATSIPLNIQLSNVIETQDCKVQIITKNRDLKVSVRNKNSKVLSSSTKENDFINYHIFSSTFHLEDTQDFSFNLVFSSQMTDVLEIKSIVLSFSENEKSHYLGSLGFDSLSQLIQDEGVAVPNSDVKYLVSKKHNKIFIMLPTEQAESKSFSYHIFPADKKDLSPKREQHGFNNQDFKTSVLYATVPKPYGLKSDYTIIQRSLPSYPWTTIRISQYSSKWRIQLTAEQ